MCARVYLSQVQTDENTGTTGTRNHACDRSPSRRLPSSRSAAQRNLNKRRLAYDPRA